MDILDVLLEDATGDGPMRDCQKAARVEPDVLDYLLYLSAYAKGKADTADRYRGLELRTMPYAEYLQTPEWTQKRDEVLRRDAFRCRVCNETRRLEVHHRTYERRGCEDLDDLTTLCRDCHGVFHKQRQLARQT